MIKKDYLYPCISVLVVETSSSCTFNILYVGRKSFCFEPLQDLSCSFHQVIKNNTILVTNLIHRRLLFKGKTTSYCNQLKTQL